MGNAVLRASQPPSNHSSLFSVLVCGFVGWGDKRTQLHCHKNNTTREIRVRVTIVAVLQTYVSRILSVWSPFALWPVQALYFVVISGLSDCTVFFHVISQRGKIFGKSWWTQNVFWFSVRLLSGTCLNVGSAKRGIVTMHVGLRVKHSLFLSDFINWTFLDKLWQNSQVSLTSIHSEPSWSTRTEMTVSTPYPLTTHRQYPLPTDWQHTDDIHSLPTDNTQTVSTPYPLTTHRQYPLPTHWQHTDSIHSLQTDNTQTVSTPNRQTTHRQ
jgi:hypothetical protein